MNWSVAYRVAAAALTLLGLLAGIIVATQNTGLDAQTLAWWGVVAAFCSGALGLLPGLFGQSGQAPPGTSENKVVAQAKQEGEAAGIRRASVASGGIKPPGQGRATVVPPGRA